MAAGEPAADLSTTGVMSRSPAEIARVLAMLLGRGEPLRSNLAGGGIVFVSRLRHVDPGRAFILLDPDPGDAANDALLARPRASLHATPEGWHIEFSASAPERAQHEGRSVIRLRFPDILVTQQRRAHERRAVEPKVPLHFVVDAGGVISFDGAMVDVSAGGLCFLRYPPDITLEPGTLLKGCRIELPGRPPATVDLEVRYSRMATLPDGRNAIRSGCRFVNTAPELRALLESFFMQ